MIRITAARGAVAAILLAIAAAAALATRAKSAWWSQDAEVVRPIVAEVTAPDCAGRAFDPGFEQSYGDLLERRLRRLDPDDDAGCYKLLESYGAIAPVRDEAAFAVFIATLTGLSGHKAAAVRAGAIAVLSRLSAAASARMSFEPWFSDSSPKVRRQAVLATARRGDRVLRERTATLARDPDARVRCAVARALRGLPADAASAAISALFLDEDADVVRAAAPGIAALPAPPTAMLIDATRNSSPVIRACAAAALGDLSRAGTFGTLAPLLDDPAGEVRVAAMRALAALPEERLPEVITLLVAFGADAARGRADRVEAVQCLAECVMTPDLEAVRGIAERDRDHLVRLAAGRCLLVHADPRAVGCVVALLAVEPDAWNDRQDAAFVRTTADATLRGILGPGVELSASPDWGRAVPALERVVGDPAFRCQAERLAEVW